MSTLAPPPDPLDYRLRRPPRSFGQVSLYTAVMNACYTVGDMDAILSLGDQLREQRLTPDHTAYHLMVTSHISKLVSVETHISRERVGCAGPFVFIEPPMSREQYERLRDGAHPSLIRCRTA